MSFFVTLSSNSNRDVYPHNHGGNFTIELNNTLDFGGGGGMMWEVALVEFWYVGQRFANITQENGVVSVRASVKRHFTNDYIITADQVDALFIKVEGELKPQGVFGHRSGEIKSYGWIRFEEQHYNQHAFEKQITLSTMRWINQNFKMPTEMVVLEYKNNVLTIKLTVVQHKRLTFTFSPALVQLLSLWRSVETFGPYLLQSSNDENRVLPTQKPEILSDTSILLLTPNDSPLYLRTNKDLVFEISGGFWTWNTLTQYIHFKVAKYNQKGVKFTVDITKDSITYVLHNVKHLKWSPSLAALFCGEVIITSNRQQELLFKETTKPVADAFLTESLPLPLLYYETTKELVSDLNLVIRQNCSEILEVLRTHRFHQPIPSFVEDEGGFVNFKTTSELQVKLSPFLISTLGLQSNNNNEGGWLMETQRATSKAALRLTPYPYLYIFVDSVLGYMVDSNQSNLIKIIDNDAQFNEHKHISISSPQYFPVMRNYINCINVVIKSGYEEEEDLLFNSETSVTLHFKCPSI